MDDLRFLARELVDVPHRLRRLEGRRNLAYSTVNVDGEEVPIPEAVRRIRSAESRLADVIINLRETRDIADGQVVAYMDDPRPTTAKEGDWHTSPATGLVSQWRDGGWKPVTSQAVVDAMKAATDAQAAADGKMVCFEGPTAPTAEGVGDLWIRTPDNRKHRWNGTSWVELKDHGIVDAANAAATAQNAANTAQGAADTAQGAADAAQAKADVLEKRSHVTENLLRNSKFRPEWVNRTYSITNLWCPAGSQHIAGSLKAAPQVLPIDDGGGVWELGADNNKVTVLVMGCDIKVKTGVPLAYGAWIYTVSAQQIVTQTRWLDSQGVYQGTGPARYLDVAAGKWQWISAGEVTPANRDGLCPGLHIRANSVNGTFHKIWVARPTLGVGDACPGYVPASSEVHALDSNSDRLKNDDFCLWRNANGVLPLGVFRYGTGTPERVSAGHQFNSLRIPVADATVSRGIYKVNWAEHEQRDLQNLSDASAYYSATVEFTVDAGTTLSGAGVLIADDSSQTNNVRTYSRGKLVDAIASPEVGKSYRVTMTMKKEGGAAKSWRKTAYFMVNHGTLGTHAAKTLTLHEFSCRDATQAEIEAFKNGEAFTLQEARLATVETGVTQANTKADSAVATATTANNTANTANSTATAANATSNQAIADAANAATASATAVSTAGQAKTTADQASATATAANTAATSATSAATSASTAATNATSTATAAKTAADAASATAGQAKTTADLAKTTADQATLSATAATTAATNATNTANTAKNTADQATTTAGQAKSTADQAKTTADQAATDATAATTAATNATNTANTAKSTADQATSTAGQAKTTADLAKTTADQATTAAGQAKTTADLAKTTADQATTAATNATNTANSAQTAAQTNKTAIEQLDKATLGPNLLRNSSVLQAWRTVSYDGFYFGGNTSATGKWIGTTTDALTPLGQETVLRRFLGLGNGSAATRFYHITDAKITAGTTIRGGFYVSCPYDVWIRTRYRVYTNDQLTTADDYPYQRFRLTANVVYWVDGGVATASNTGRPCLQIESEAHANGNFPSLRLCGMFLAEGTAPAKFSLHPDETAALQNRDDKPVFNKDFRLWNKFHPTPIPWSTWPVGQPTPQRRLDPTTQQTSARWALTSATQDAGMSSGAVCGNIPLTADYLTCVASFTLLSGEIDGAGGRLHFAKSGGYDYLGFTFKEAVNQPQVGKRYDITITKRVPSPSTTYTNIGAYCFANYYYPPAGFDTKKQKSIDVHGMHFRVATPDEVRSLLARELVDGKNTTHFKTGNPTAGEHTKGDVWYKHAGEDVVGIWEWNGTAWVSKKIASEVVASLTADKIRTGTLAAGTSIVCGNSTSSHVKLTSSGLEAFDSSGQSVIRLGTGDDVVRIDQANGAPGVAIDRSGTVTSQSLVTGKIHSSGWVGHGSILGSTARPETLAGTIGGLPQGVVATGSGSSISGSVDANTWFYVPVWAACAFRKDRAYRVTLQGLSLPVDYDAKVLGFVQFSNGVGYPVPPPAAGTNPAGSSGTVRHAANSSPSLILQGNTLSGLATLDGSRKYTVCVAVKALTGTAGALDPWSGAYTLVVEDLGATTFAPESCGGNVASAVVSTETLTGVAKVVVTGSTNVATLNVASTTPSTTASPVGTGWKQVVLSGNPLETIEATMSTVDLLDGLLRFRVVLNSNDYEAFRVYVDQNPNSVEGPFDSTTSVGAVVTATRAMSFVEVDIGEIIKSRAIHPATATAKVRIIPLQTGGSDATIHLGEATVARQKNAATGTYK